MTKKGKNKKLVALAGVLAVTCACGTAQALVASDVYSDPIAIAAESTQGAAFNDADVLLFDKICDFTDIGNSDSFYLSFCETCAGTAYRKHCR